MTLNIEDINDNPPVFVRDTSFFSVLDSTPIGSKIGTVLALDRDSGLNGEVQYRLESGGDSGYFVVDKEDGEIKTTGELFTKVGKWRIISSGS